MLTIYEQIQLSVDFVERNLSNSISAGAAAQSAGMSLRSFHRYFAALTGYRFGEYVRKRRLSEAVDRLIATEDSVLEIALLSGYDSNEAFTRAFKKEYGAPPRRFRSGRFSAHRTVAVDLIGEIEMGVLTRSLPDMDVVCFDGFRPDPEETAMRKMRAWMKSHPELVGSHRIFGHNIDADGRLAHDPDNEGYEVKLTVPHPVPPDDDTRPETIEAGRFVVTGIEGSFEEDPSGAWITEGWLRLTEMTKRNRLEVHPSGRWFEELLEPTEAGRTRFDLYLEIT